MSQGDHDRIFNELITPDFHVENRSRSAFGDRSASEFRASLEKLGEMVGSTRTWNSVVHWLSPTTAIGRFDRDAVGRDGEKYAWTHIAVTEIREGRFASGCLFELDDEEAAFLYAEERVRAATSRLSLTNLARRTWDEGLRALQTRHADGAVACYAEPFVYDDRRRLAGMPIGDVRTAHERILAQYNHFEGRTLAVRGERLHLGWIRWSNDSGFETCYLIVHEVDQNRRIAYEGRFDEDDFEGAYVELERRYFAGEGAEFAEAGLVADRLTIAMDRGEFDRILADFTDPAFCLENRSRSIFPNRSASEMTAGFEETLNMVVSTRTWNSVLCWLSPSVLVSNFEREATGADAERYAWSGISVAVLRDGKIASVCLFESEDEATAFAYAEERVRLAEQR